MYDILIIGSGPAGLSAAVYAKRANLSVAIVEKEYEGTGQIAESGRVDNYLGLPGISGYDMGEKFREHAVSFGTEFIAKEAVDIQRSDADGGLPFYIVTFRDNTVAQAKTIIYAAGATPRRADVPGEETFLQKGVSYCAICDGSFYKDKTVAVLGGGDTALDDALYLSELASKVYLIHRRAEFRGAHSTLKQVREKANVELILSDSVAEITGDKKVTGLTLVSGRKLDVNGVFVAFGSVPQTAIVGQLVELDERGYIVAGEDGKTNLPGFFAAGDARAKELRQVVTAVADGANAATSAITYIYS